MTLAFGTGSTGPLSSVVTVPAIVPVAAVLIARSQGKSVNICVPYRSHRKLRPRSKSMTISAPSLETFTG